MIHTLKGDALREQFIANKNFASELKINVDTNYSASPQSSGIYPLYPEYYNISAELLSIQASSSDMYPDEYPNYSRRGFLFQNIMVAPRQSTGMSPETIFFKSNINYWIAQYQGGQLFETILYNQVSLLKTNWKNYGSDRLAIYLFRNLFLFLSCWTNFQFVSLPPHALVKMHFELNPEDYEPLWTVFLKYLKILNFII